MARYVYAFLGFALLSPPALAKPEATQGKLSIFRWNQGFRAEREPVFVGKMPEKDFRSMVRDGKLPESKEIYSGCYLAHFEAEKPDRAPASATEAKPKSEVFRICR
jgi:hypothetical protein